MSLRGLALVSGIYDLGLGISMLFLAPTMAQIFGAPAPVPLINAQLNGVFAASLALGYFWAREDPEARRGYFWVAGVFAKGLGAALFVWDHFARGSPAAFLTFAGIDGGLSLVTLWLLLVPRAGSFVGSR